MPITVGVRLFGDMTRFDPAHRTRLHIELPDGASVGVLLQALGIDEREPVIIGIGGRLAGRETALADRDEVELLTPMAGG